MIIARQLSLSFHFYHGGNVPQGQTIMARLKRQSLHFYQDRNVPQGQTIIARLKRQSLHFYQDGNVPQGQTMIARQLIAGIDEIKKQPRPVGTVETYHPHISTIIFNMMFFQKLAYSITIEKVGRLKALFGIPSFQEGKEEQTPGLENTSYRKKSNSKAMTPVST